MRVLVIGIGYTGSVLCNELLNLGYDVRAFDNLYKCDPSTFIPLHSCPRFEFMYGDVREERDIQRAINGVNYVVLLAGLVGAPICNKYPDLSYEVTVQGSENVMKVKPVNIPLFYSSTGSVFGELNEVCTENSPTNPLSTYAQHKLLAEEVISQGKNSVIYRFATAMGLGVAPRLDLLINDLTYQACTHGHLDIFQPDVRRTFIHVQDFAESIVFGIQRLPLLRHSLYNVGSEDNNWSKREVVEYIREKTNCSVNYHAEGKDIDARNYFCSFSRLNQDGWFAKIGVKESIDEMVRASNSIKLQREKYAKV